jgi:hypothetical protein
MKITKRIIVTALIIVLVFIGGNKFILPKIYSAYIKGEAVELSFEPVLGMYNRKDTLPDKTLMQVQHVLIRWNKAEASSFPKL